MNQAEIGHDDVGENSNDGQVATSATSNINDIRNRLYVLPTTTGSGKIVDGERLEDGLGAGRNRQQPYSYHGYSHHLLTQVRRIQSAGAPDGPALVF